MTLPERQTEMRRRLQRWYGQHQRDLPWRRTRDPYAIAISEVMLQQTQVSRVQPKYEAWIERWPTPQALAAASTSAVLRAWSGLGYNRRALWLREAARQVVSRYNGQWPTDPAELLTLKGFGPYTAAAISIFSTDASLVAFDTNINRIYNRVFGGVQGVSASKRERLALTTKPLSKNDLWHHALMDLGAIVCLARQPKCLECPLRDICRAYPRILTLPTNNKRSTSEAFSDSERFWRGRVVAEFTKKSTWTRRKLCEALQAHGTLKTDRFDRIVLALTKDGFLRKSGQNLRLRA